MCGRFVSASSPERIAAYFGAETNVETLGENFNVAPTNDVYGVVASHDGKLEVAGLPLGLVPVWAKERKIGSKMINARAETIAEKPAFKAVFKKHRCIIPMDGFYEWAAGRRRRPGHQGRQAAKQPTSSTASTASRWPSPGCGRRGRTKSRGRRRAVAAQLHGGHHAAPTARCRRSTTGCR